MPRPKRFADMKEYQRVYMNERNAKRKLENLCCFCNNYADRTRFSYCEQCRKRAALKARERRTDLKQTVMSHYGGACVCCGIRHITFLCIDHIYDNGASQRKALNNKGSAHFYSWIIRNNYPKDLQILCYNCNMGKQLNGGICPHNEEV